MIQDPEFRVVTDVLERPPGAVEVPEPPAESPVEPELEVEDDAPAL